MGLNVSIFDDLFPYMSPEDEVSGSKVDDIVSERCT